MDVICRLCCETDGTINIFNDTKLLSKKIMYCCTNIRVSVDDGLPALVCQTCEKELSNAYNFIMKCEAADAKLRSLVTTIANLDKYEVKPDVKLEETDDTFEEFVNDLNADMLEVLNQEQDVESQKSINTSKVKKYKVSKSRPKKKKKSQTLLQCNDCGRMFKNNSFLIAHMRKHSDHRPFECTFCDKKYKDVAGLKRHIDTNHNKNRQHRFICETCGKSFYTKAALKIHNRTHSGETPYECKICAKKFNQIGSLLRHRQGLHTSERNHGCPQCDKKFITKDELRRHFISHSTIKKFICTICNAPFKYANSLKKHVNLHYQTAGYICDYCSQTFNTKGSLRAHIGRRHSDKSGFCDVCSKSVSNFEVHMYKHTGKTPFKCEQCSSSYSTKNALTKHINFRHKNTNKYMCSVNKCTESFPSKQMLEFHVAKYHEAKILFPCDRCSKGFYRKSDLSRHKQFYHKGLEL